MARKGDNAILGGALAAAVGTLGLTFGLGLHVLIALPVSLLLGGAVALLLWPETAWRRRFRTLRDSVGYDRDLMLEELEAAEANRALLAHVAREYPRHPVSAPLARIGDLVEETMTYLADTPGKYRDLRPLLVTHLDAAADIARLIERIKGSGETLDDPDAVARRLDDLATLMQDARRRSTRAERARLDASMRLIDHDLQALAARRGVEERLNAKNTG